MFRPTRSWTHGPLLLQSSLCSIAPNGKDFNKEVSETCKLHRLFSPRTLCSAKPSALLDFRGMVFFVFILSSLSLSLSVSLSLFLSLSLSFSLSFSLWFYLYLSLYLPCSFLFRSLFLSLSLAHSLVVPLPAFLPFLLLPLPSSTSAFS